MVAVPSTVWVTGGGDEDDGRDSVFGAVGAAVDGRREVALVVVAPT